MAENVGFVVAVWRGAGGKGFFVIADAVFIEERPIDQILTNQYPGDSGHQRGIGARTDGDPFIFPPGGSIGIAGVNDNHPRVGAFSGRLQIPGDTAAAHAGVRRVVAEHHHQFAVFDIRGAVTLVAAVGVGHGAGNLGGTVGAVLIQRPAIAVHQTGDRRGRRRGTGHIAADNSRRIVNVNRLVAVVFDDSLQIAGNSLQRLFPADARKLAFAAFADAFHRVIQAIRVVDSPANGTAA